MSVYDFMRAHPGLAAVAAAAMGPSTARVPAAVSPTAPHAAPAPKELTAAQREIVAEAESESRLRSAMLRQIERVRPGAAISHATDAQLANELRRTDGDSVELGLAKSMARLLVKQVGVEKSAASIERVRALREGRPMSASHSTRDPSRSPHVIGAAPRR
jgi:hypothetical protein